MLASLTLLFASGANALDPRIAFTRGSLATQFDASGKLIYCPNNLLLNSANLAAASWSYSSAASATTNTVTLSGGASYYGQPVIVPVGANGVIAAVLSGSGTVALRDANSGAQTVVTLTATPTLYYFTETFAASTGYLVLDNRTAYGADGAAKTVTVGGTYMSVVTYETAPRAQDQVATGASAYYGPRFDYGNFRTNLLSYSESFDNAAWRVAWCNVSANTTTAPDGSSSADTLVEDTTNISHPVYRTVGNFTAGVSYTISCHIKAFGKNKARIVLAGTAFPTSSPYVDIDLVAGTASAGHAPVGVGVTSYGNGWYRCSVTATASASGNGDIYIQPLNAVGVSNYLGDGTGALYLWGAQLETGTVATAYIPTTSGPATVGQPLGLLLEPTATNTVLNSGNVGGSQWNSFNGSLGAAGVAPDGTNSAALVTGSNAGAGYYGTNLTSQTAGSAYTTSGFFKYTSGSTTLRLVVAGQAAFGGTGGDRYVEFNGSTGAFVAKSAEVSAYTIQPIANGWWRVSGTYAPTSTGMPAMAFYSGSGGASTFYAWGAQMEQGAAPTSYIPTVGAAVTRNADVPLMPTAGWFNSSQGTFVVEFDLPDYSKNPRVIGYGAGRAFVSIDASGRASTYNGTATSITANSVTINAVTKVAHSYGSGVSGLSGLSMNGGAVSSGTVMPDTAPTLYLGNYDNVGGSYGYGSPLMGHIRRLTYYPRAITGSALQQLAA